MPPPDPNVGGVSARHPRTGRKDIHVSPSSDGRGVNTIGEELNPIACWKLNDVRFLFGSSFLLPQTRGEFLELLQLRREHAGTTFTIFGHADPVSNDTFNKQLSGHRAEAVYATLVRDVAMWERLYLGGGQAEGWGIASIQHMLTALGFAPGPVTGSRNAATTDAVKQFQSRNELRDDGDPGPKTRAKLFLAYMIFICPDAFDKAEFLGGGADAHGKGDYQGCSEFNPLVRFSQAEETAFNQPANRDQRNEENRINRRVMVLLFPPGQHVAPTDWPCPRTSEGIEGCRRRFFSDGDHRRNPQAARREFNVTKDTFACRFYQRLVDASPCEGIIPPPEQVLDGVNPIIFFKEAADAGTVGVDRRVVLVEKPHTSPAIDDVDVELTTDVPHDGTGTFTFAPAGKLKFFRGATEIQFNGTDNVFTGAELAGRVGLRCQGVHASDAIDDVRLTLTLSGGSRRLGGPAVVALTVVEVTLDICEPRTSATTDPTPMAQPTSSTPAAAPPPRDKFFGGRGLLVQDANGTVERAMLIVRRILPAAFTGNVVLTRVGDHVSLFANETPQAGEAALAQRIVFPATEISGAEKRFFVQGATLSTAMRDCHFQLGVERFDEDADAVSITVVDCEIVSDVAQNALQLVDRAPERPARTTHSTFFPAPLIVGVNYDVRLRPHLQLPTGPGNLTTFQWSSTVPAASLRLTNATAQVLGLRALRNSAALDDFSVDVIVDGDAGKLKKSHKFTAVTVVIDPVINNELPALNADINFIRNPAVTPIFNEGASAPTTEAPIIDITTLTPNLGFTADDLRIAWWIVGDQPAGATAYDGRANFLNSDAGRYGTRVQIAGRIKGDILVQPYSGGFPYGMFRTRVEPLHSIKYRVNILSSDPVPAGIFRPASPARVPSQTHAGAVNHIRMANLYLRQVGLQLVPDDSAATPLTPGNTTAGLPGLDGNVVSATLVQAGHFDVRMNRQDLTFQVTSSDASDSVRINGRNEVVIFAYMHSLLQSSPTIIVLAQAQNWPPNHAPGPRTTPPSATFIQTDAGTPSTSLIPPDGIPPNPAAGTVSMNVIPASNGLVLTRPTQTARHRDLMWGIAVPTTTMDTFCNGVAPGNPAAAFGCVLAHEVGHVLGMNHRTNAASGDPYPDGLVIPSTKNVMFPMASLYPLQENFDIIQAKAMRFSELLFRNP